MWIAKDKETRRKEFLQTGIELFKEQGLDATSINHILKKMNITKGSFYYHFKSKEQLVDQIMNLFIEDIDTIVDKVANSDINALAMLELLYKEVSNYRNENKTLYADLYELLKNERNQGLKLIYQKKTEELYFDFVKSIIEQGVTEGFFDTVDIQETSIVFFTTLNIFKAKITDFQFSTESQNKEDIQITVESYQKILERILGAKEGDLSFYKSISTRIEVLS